MNQAVVQLKFTLRVFLTVDNGLTIRYPGESWNKKVVANNSQACIVVLTDNRRLLATAMKNFTTTTVALLCVFFVDSLILFLYRRDNIVIGQIYVTTDK